MVDLRPVEIPSSILDDIIRIATYSPDEEVCGVVLRGQHIPMRNAALPVFRAKTFELDPAEQIAVWRKWNKEGEMTMYHSHPRGSSAPSTIDQHNFINANTGVSFLIFSVETGWFRAFRVSDIKVVEVKLIRT